MAKKIKASRELEDEKLEELVGAAPTREVVIERSAARVVTQHGKVRRALCLWYAFARARRPHTAHRPQSTTPTSIVPQEGSLYKDTFEPLIVRSRVNKAAKNAPDRFSYLGAKNLFAVFSELRREWNLEAAGYLAREIGLAQRLGAFPPYPAASAQAPGEGQVYLALRQATLLSCNLAEVLAASGNPPFHASGLKVTKWLSDLFDWWSETEVVSFPPMTHQSSWRTNSATHVYVRWGALKVPEVFLAATDRMLHDDAWDSPPATLEMACSWLDGWFYRWARDSLATPALEHDDPQADELAMTCRFYSRAFQSYTSYGGNDDLLNHADDFLIDGDEGPV